MRADGRTEDSARRFNLRIFDINNFTLREALWIAILVHLIILMLPGSVFVVNNVLLPALSEEQSQPLVFSMVPPKEAPTTEPKNPDSIPSDRNREPRYIEQPRANPETIQPRILGDTNLEQLPSGAPERFEESAAPPESADAGSEIERPKEEPAEAQNPGEKRQDQINQKLGEMLENKSLIPQMDLPYSFDQRKNSEDGPLSDMFELSTYAWDYQPWLAKLRWKIYKFWPPKLKQTADFLLGKDGYTVWHVVVERDGRIRQINLRQPSVSNPYDLASKYAIEVFFPGLDTPFPPLPEDFPLNTLEITMHFFIMFYR
jgi:hypothetical protein